jgi:hypothetical protein
VSVATRPARIHDGVHPGIQNWFCAWQAPECGGGRDKQEPYGKKSDNHLYQAQKRKKKTQKEGRKGEEERAAANSDKVTKLEGLYVAALAGKLFITASSSTVTVEDVRVKRTSLVCLATISLFREDNEHEADVDFLSWSVLWPSFRPSPKNNAQFASLIVGLNSSSG